MHKIRAILKFYTLQITTITTAGVPVCTLGLPDIRCLFLLFGFGCHCMNSIKKGTFQGALVHIYENPFQNLRVQPSETLNWLVLSSIACPPVGP